jgi:hypothetical protein
MQSKRTILYSVFAIFLLANIACWLSVRHVQAKWANVPPPPSAFGASVGAMGDRQMAYRVGALMLQNFGDMGGRTTRLSEYNFERLGQWFMLEDALDPRAVHVPYVASFYYGGVPDGKKLRPLIEYLAYVGRRQDAHQRMGYQNWRWMGQAVYLARFKLEDLNLALTLANELAAMYKPGMPAWTKQMPVFVTSAQGDKKAAYALMLSILKEDAKTMQKAEVNFMLWYICSRLLTSDEAKANSLCIENPDAMK